MMNYIDVVSVREKDAVPYVEKYCDKKGQNHFNSAGENRVYQRVFNTDIQRAFRKKHYKIVQPGKPPVLKIPHRHTEKERGHRGDDKNEKKTIMAGTRNQVEYIFFLFIGKFLILSSTV